MNTPSDLRTAHKAAVLASADIVSTITVDDLRRPTPLRHMTVQHRGFAGAYRAAVDDVLDAFAADGVLEATFALAEFGADASLPGATAIGFHFVDYVVHGWDAARSIDTPFALPDDVIVAAVPIALRVPDGDFRAVEGSPFARALDEVDGERDIDRILRHLGRAPDWAPTVVA
ncbi:DinB family protein [Mycobacteroides salmoniphilum]|uniref:TIGR03086 family protein n=1 Tax=Mycobacteroides salmoniphilum TaxID=404941 RepID=UPI000992EB53|nr:TIGR03086 family protein [Mycobacteroides salmoniphilum]